MKSSNTKLLAGIFAILLLIVLAPSIFQKLNLFQKKEDNLGLIQIKKGGVSKIFIKTGSEKIELKKENNLWMAGKYKASESAINDFFMSLENSEESSLVSKNKENQAEFGVDEKNGTFLTLYLGKSEVSYVLGKSGPELGSFYMRRAKENNVYLVKGGLKDKTLTSVNDWRDKTIIAINQKDITKIEITGKYNFSLIKEKNEWKKKSATSEQSVKERSISGILTNLSNLLADGFLQEEEIKEFEEAKEKNTIVISGEKTSLAELKVWQKEKEGDYFITVKGKEDFFRVYSYKLADLFKLGE